MKPLSNIFISIFAIFCIVLVTYFNTSLLRKQLKEMEIKIAMNEAEITQLKEGFANSIEFDQLILKAMEKANENTIR